jgi:hypothetical protein
MGVVNLTGPVNWSTDAFGTYSGFGTVTGLDGVLVAGTLTPVVSPGWTVGALVGRRMSLGGTWYSISANTATACTITAPPGDGTYTYIVGGTPLAGDTVYLGTTGSTGYALTLDGANNSTYTCTLIQASNGTTANSGTIVLGNAISILASSIVGGTSNMITMTGQTLSVINVSTGVTNASVSVILVNSGTNSLTITGNISSANGQGSSTIGLRFDGGTNTFSFGGNATGGIGPAIYQNTNTSFNVGTATGGTGGGGHGIVLRGNATVNVTTAIGGSAAAGVQIGNGTTTYPILNVTNATGSSGAPGVLAYFGVTTVTTATGCVGGFPGVICGLFGSTVSPTVVINGTNLLVLAPPVGYTFGSLRVTGGVRLLFFNGSGSPTKFYDATVMADVKKVLSFYSYGGGDFSGVRDDCPAASALYGTFYGDPTAQTQGTYYAPAQTDVVKKAAAYYGVSAGTNGLYSPPNVSDGYTADASKVLTTAHFGANNATAGTFDATLYTLISGVVSAAYVLTGHTNYSGGAAGSLTLPADGTKVLTGETAFGVSGSIVPSATLPLATHVLNDQTYGVAGTGSTGSLTLPADGSIVLVGNTFGIAGTSIVGAFSESSRNTDPGIANVKSGVTYTILNVPLTGTFAGGGGAAEFIIGGM